MKAEESYYKNYRRKNCITDRYLKKKNDIAKYKGKNSWKVDE